jgi:alanine dehydrogenase
MVIGIPREIMRNEKRVPLFPETISILKERIKNREVVFLA